MCGGGQLIQGSGVRCQLWSLGRRQFHRLSHSRLPPSLPPLQRGEAAPQGDARSTLPLGKAENGSKRDRSFKTRPASSPVRSGLGAIAPNVLTTTGSRREGRHRGPPARPQPPFQPSPGTADTLRAPGGTAGPARPAVLRGRGGGLGSAWDAEACRRRPPPAPAGRRLRGTPFRGALEGRARGRARGGWARAEGHPVGAAPGDSETWLPFPSERAR